jgi:hypothetical protein
MKDCDYGASTVLGFPQVEYLAWQSGTSASALGGDVRPKLSGRKKSMTTEAIPVELGSLHCTERERVGSSPCLDRLNL